MTVSYEFPDLGTVSIIGVESTTSSNLASTTALGIACQVLPSVKEFICIGGVVPKSREGKGNVGSSLTGG